MISFHSKLLALAPALALVLTSTAVSQQRKPPSQAELIKQRDEKLAKPVFEKAHWIKDYDEALAEAKKSNKPIFAYFTRSYAY